MTWAAAAASVAGMMLIAGAGSAGAGQTPAYTPVAGSSVPFTSYAKATGRVAAATRLSIQVWLKPDIAAAQTFAAAVSTPGSAQYHHYLSPASYAASFGPAVSTAVKVASWLRAQGFTNISTGPGRSYVRATAPASAIDSAFRTTLRTYQPSAGITAGRYNLRANSGPVSVPSSLSGSVIGVTGLDNAAPVTLDRTAGPTSPGCSQYFGQHLATGWPKAFGTTTFSTPICGYSAGQLRAAYGASTANTGRGQTIALVELGLTEDMFLTLKDYAAANKLPAPSAKRYTELSLGQDSACGDPFDVEEQLDVEASYAMAPSVNQLVVGGDSCDNGDGGLQGLLDADLAVLNGPHNRPRASIASNSWENPTGEAQGGAVTSIEHAYLVQAAAEGVGMYFSTGDSSGVESPATDPYAIAVGGTTLGIGKTGNRLFETGWSTNFYVLSENAKSWVEQGELGAAGGGPSLLWSQPAYQYGVVPAALATPPGDRGGLVRAVPDISADADELTGMAVGQLTPIGTTGTTFQYSESPVGGTSLATPLVAGMVAAAQQGQAHPFGFINPALYKLAGTGALHDILPVTSSTPVLYRGVWCNYDDECPNSEFNPALGQFDVQSYGMQFYTGQVTLKGYDTMTGLGTPNGQAFISALRALEKK